MSACTVGSIFMQVGDNDSATFWLERALDSYAPGVLTVADVNTWSYLTELAIRRGHVDNAELYLARCLPAVARAKSPRSLARGLSLQTQLAVLKGEHVTESHLHTFIEVFDVVRAATWQDYSAESLLLGLISANRHGEASRLAKEYLSQDRRDNSALAVPLAKIIGQLSADRDANASQMNV
jgi:hypothetical protein